MLQTFVFKNKDGRDGIFQKDDDIVHIFLELYPLDIYECTRWHLWEQQIDSGYIKGDRDSPSADAISFFIRKYAENVSHIVQDVVQVDQPGYYFPRMNRGSIRFNYVNDAFHLDMRAYRNIQTSLDSLFDVLEPHPKNFVSYGHKIRELLILTCTEVEFLLLKVLTENGYPEKDRYSTRDYVICLDLLKLDQWKAELIQYPSIKTFAPFANWSKDHPTNSLPWYRAYNAVKHNRGDNIDQANFEHALDAVAALHVLLSAQYGNQIFDSYQQRTEERSIFVNVATPEWSVHEKYAPIFRDEGCIAQWASAQYFASHPSPGNG
ncbi:hypothetical protein [Pusillimonas sp. NJUB218]|uniref:hypothetical protein n=1 Tax=Pusillimonas sp. NJUB218 TaxID=2023230 RepID=UPI000F4B545D|nr:hypothetical protein [Pusillimonas sp. NJUB218]ROT46081.1 hypothetical protein CHR62_03640 [Pusillimonas sp. NJUB218]